VVVQRVGRIRESHPPAEHREVLLLLRRLLCKESGGGEKKTKWNEESAKSHGQDIMKPETPSARGKVKASDLLSAGIDPGADVPLSLKSCVS